MRIPLNRFSLEALLAWGLGSLIIGGLIGAVLAFSVWRVTDSAFDEYEKQDAPLALNASKGADAWRKARDYEEALLTSYGGSLEPGEAEKRYLPLWKTSMDQVRAYLAEMRRLGGENDQRVLALLPDTEKALDRYVTNLTQVVGGLTRLGRADSGLESEIRAKSREIEAALAKNRSVAVQESLGRLQRIRMDYALTGRDRYIEEFDAEAQNFQRLAAGAPAGQTLLALGKDFAGLFGQYVRIAEGMTQQKEAILEAAKQLDPGVELLEKESLGNAHDALLVFEQRATRIAAVSAVVAVVAVLLGLLIAVLIGGRIRLATQRIIGFATHVAAGRLGARLDELDTGEFGALESALNTMADRLQQSDEIMNRQARLLEASSRRIGLLSELTSLLQTAQDMEEAVRISGRHLNEMRLAQSGALYLYQEAGDRLEALAQWGEGHPAPGFAPADCWALRRGQPYGTSEGMTAIVCAHSTHGAQDGEQVSYLCLPMLAQGAMIGLLYVVFGDVDDEQREEDTRFARRLSEQLSLALANLKLRQSLREQSLSDALTQLANRRYLEECLPRELARAQREKGRLAVLMVDADHFKRFNDEHGHEAGDAALRQLGRLLKQNCRASDLACRYGGEEFTVILPGTDAEGAQEWARRLLEATHRTQIRCNGGTLGPLTVSIGAAVYPEHGEEVDVLMQAADAALYEAKHAGRDQLSVAKSRLRAV